MTWLSLEAGIICKLYFIFCIFLGFIVCIFLKFFSVGPIHVPQGQGFIPLVVFTLVFLTPEQCLSYNYDRMDLELYQRDFIF